ncbi:hypothetical protein L1987_70222 [Smallanthus sonchifolius]|uniref:Uncharacterized protein n=1 Tax=Smallanthus sonchifolius TaxID=185202 RepID=A0ACB9ANA7_9ASTR|nr:hypothetical protein L1987_70222 [Smallanthus sonchifolius]
MVLILKSCSINPCFLCSECVRVQVINGVSVRECVVTVVKMNGDSGISAFPEEDNIFCWKGTIPGSKDTVF